MSKQQNQGKRAKAKKIQFKNIEELEQINLNAAGIDIGAYPFIG
jgi:transposase